MTRWYDAVVIYQAGCFVFVTVGGHSDTVIGGRERGRRRRDERRRRMGLAVWRIKDLHTQPARCSHRECGI